MSQHRPRSQSSKRSVSLNTIANEDLNKFTRQQLLKTAKKMGIQNLYKKYLSKAYLVELITTVNRHQQVVRAKRGSSKTRLYERKQKQFKKGKIRFAGERTTISGMNIKTYYPIKFHKRSDMTYDELIRFYQYLEQLSNNVRSIVTVHLRHEDGNYEQIKVADLIQRENGYMNAFDIKDYIILKIEVKELPQRGGCDVKEHTITSIHHMPDGSKIQLTIRTTKTKYNNCLINIFAKAAGLKRQNANFIRKQLGIPLDVPLEPEKAEILSKHFQVSYKIFSFVDSGIKIITESKIQYNKYVEIYLDSQLCHYSILLKRPDDLIRFKPQHQIQDTTQQIETGAEKVIVLGEQQEQEPLLEYTHKITYSEVLNDPHIETIKDRIYNTPYHIFIYGQGGVGKTWTINQLEGITKTATTGIAATHIDGNTIHYHMIRKLKDCSDIIVIDEISMMGTSLFQRLIQLIEDSKRQIKLVISGDILQLPPVNDGFFFQCYEYVKFAKKCIRINLNQIKRQDNTEQQQFLNDLRIGKVNKPYIKSLTQNKVVNPQIIICGKNSAVDTHNQQAMNQLLTPKITFKPRIEYIKQQNEVSKKIYCKAVKEYEPTILCVGAKVMLLNNMDVQSKLVNGSIGQIKQISQSEVLVQFPNQEKWIPYVKEIIDNQISVAFMPLRPCYAITVHKSQGCTFDSAIVENQDLFENGQMYVALSRVRDLNNITITGTINEIFMTKAFKPNMIAYDFCFKNTMMTQSEIM